MADDTHEKHYLDVQQAPQEPVDSTKSVQAQPATSVQPKRQLAILILVNLSQLVNQYSYGSAVGCAFSIATSLYYGIEGSTQIVPPEAANQIAANAVWIAAASSLTLGTFILVGGRVGAIYGHKAVLTAACIWWVIWQIASGFAPGVITLCVFRALGGIGNGFIAPNAVALLAITFPPGKKRNLALGLFSSMSPIGASLGILIASLLVQLTAWKWAFFYAAILGTVVFTTMVLVLPWDQPRDPHGSFDFLGAYLGIAGLVLFNFAWNQAPWAPSRWATPYVYAVLIVSIVHLVAFAAWEARVSTPLLPSKIWKAPAYRLLTFIAFCSFMAAGIFYWYFVLFGLNIRHYSLIENGAHVAPIAVLGLCGALLAAFLMPRLAPQYIIAIGNLASLGSGVLLATTPANQTYWAMLFPAVILAAFTTDLIYAAAQIITSASVDKNYQGAAGSLVGTLLGFGFSTGLGFAGTVEVYTNDGGNNVLGGYRHAMYFAVGLSGMSLVLSLLFLRMPRSTQEGWGKENGESSSSVPSNSVSKESPA